MIKKMVFASTVGDVPIYVIDNQAKTTVVFLHGIKANWAFAKNIFDRQNNFNIVSFDFPHKNVRFETMIKLVDEISESFLVGHNFVYLGHSLGAAVALSLTYRKKIKQLILVAPLNPSLVDTVTYSVLRRTALGVQGMRKVGDALVKNSVRIVKKLQQSPLAQELLNRESEYKHLREHQLLNIDFLKNDLDYLFKKYKARYVIGALDQVIPTAAFTNYVINELDSEVRVIRWARHNPFKDNHDAMHRYLNDLIPFEKRFFLSRFYATQQVKNVAAVPLPAPTLNLTRRANTEKHKPVLQNVLGNGGEG